MCFQTKHKVVEIIKTNYYCASYCGNYCSINDTTVSTEEGKYMKIMLKCLIFKQTDYAPKGLPHTGILVLDHEQNISSY